MFFTLADFGNCGVTPCEVLWRLFSELPHNGTYNQKPCEEIIHLSKRQFWSQCGSIRIFFDGPSDVLIVLGLNGRYQQLGQRWHQR